MTSIDAGTFDVAPGRSANRWWPWLRGALVVVGLGLVAYVVWTVWNGEAIARWKSQASPLTFFAVMAFLPAIGIPISPLFILAGATFGRRIGIVGSLLALAANLGLCYWVARGALRPWLRRLMRRFDTELPDFEGRRRGAWRFTIMLKFAPGLPAFLKNYSLGVAGVPFALYFAASLLITGAYGVALIVLGESLFKHQERRVIVVVAVVVAFVAVAWLLRRRRNRRRATA